MDGPKLLKPFSLAGGRPAAAGLEFLGDRRKSTNGVPSINGMSSQGSYPQPLRSPAPEGRRSGAMDNFQASFG